MNPTVQTVAHVQERCLALCKRKKRKTNSIISNEISPDPKDRSSIIAYASTTRPSDDLILNGSEVRPSTPAAFPGCLNQKDPSSPRSSTLRACVSPILHGVSPLQVESMDVSLRLDRDHFVD